MSNVRRLSLMQTKVKLRFVLLCIAGLGIGVFCFVEAWSSLQTGIASLPLRRGVAFTFSRQDNFSAFAATVALFSLIGLILCTASAWQVMALYRPHDPESQKVISNAIAQVERDAPSGLVPLLVGLLVVTLCLAIYAAA